jgi:SAM-dependent methyltransferase
MVWDTVWEDVFKARPWGKYPGEDLIRFVASNFYGTNERNKIKLLEVGCATGANLWYMGREGFSVYGVEGSETAAHIAQERLNRDCPGWTGEVKVGDILKLPFKADTFDAVIDVAAVCCNSFEDSRAIYSEMARVCKRGGAFFSRTLAAGCWGDGLGTKVGHNAWLATEGPLAGIGYCRYTVLDEIPTLVNPFQISTVELLLRTMENRSHEIREWVITGKKP